MLTPPAISEEQLHSCLAAEYDLHITSIEFLPLGVDVDAAVYRVKTARSRTYFLKLRLGLPDDLPLRLTAYLSRQGLAQVIPPIPTRAGQLWSGLEDFYLVLYPYVSGENGYAKMLTQSHWAQLAAALHTLHHLQLPPELARRLPPESYSPAWRTQVRPILDRMNTADFTEPLSAELAAFLRNHQTRIQTLLRRTHDLAASLAEHTHEFVLCHGDLHAGNLLLAPGGALYLVDWDAPVLAPRERDLMFIGGGLLGNWFTPAAEEARFYPAYGPVRPNPAALAYYRGERVIQDIAAFCHQITTGENDTDRRQALRYLASSFEPGAELDIALQSGSSREAGGEHLI